MRVRFGLDLEGAGAASGLSHTGSSAGKVLAVAAPAPVLAAPAAESSAVLFAAAPALAPASLTETVDAGASKAGLFGIGITSEGAPTGAGRDLSGSAANGGINKGSGAGTSELLSAYHFDAGDNRYEFTGNQDIDAVLFGSRWTLSTITFSFPTSGAQYATPYYDPGYLTSHVAFNAAQQTGAEYALLTLARGYIGTFINEIAPSLANPATIRLSQTTDNSLPSAEGNFPGSDSWDGDIWFGQTGQPFYLTPQIGNWGQATIMHEIGHALGLKHGHSDYTGFDLTVGGYLDGPGPRFGTRALPASHDSWAYSIMTYRSDPGNNAGGDPSFQGDQFNQPQTFMQNDIAALQYMYGADFTSPEAHPTDTVYTFNSTTGRMSINGVGQETPTFDAVNNIGKIFRTIWDGGGVDTYDFDNYTTNQTIDLTPGGWSTMKAAQLADLRPLSATYIAAPGNIANALLYNGDTRSLIENANGGSGNDTVYGNVGNNTVHGNGGNDTVFGSDGNDLLYGEAGNDTLDGWSGDDTSYGGDGNDSQYGYSGNDNLYGNDGTDTLLGESGNDYLSGGAGGDSMVGGTGNDTLYVDDAGDVVSEGASGGTDTVYSLITYTLGAELENLSLVGSLNINGTGNSLNNVIYGNSFNNVLMTGGGTDTIYGQSGDDVIYSSGSGYYDAGAGNDTVFAGLGASETLIGGSGTDLLDTTSFSGAYNINLATGVTNFPPEAFTLFENVNSGAGADTITGTAGANIITTNGGNDLINADAGNDSVDGGIGVDTLNGGTGNDTMVGGAGADLVNGDDGNDVITSSGDSGTYNGGVGNDTLYAGLGNETMTGGSGTDLLDTTSYSGNYVVNLATGATNFAGELYTGFEQLTSGAGNDSLTGTSSANVINGGAGNDTILGGGGADTMNGQAGDDYIWASLGTPESLDGGAGTDTLNTSLYTGNYLVNLVTGATNFATELFVNFENLISGSGNDTLVGTGGANSIDGGAGNDDIDANGGNDTVDGGAGDDYLHSTGAGAKTYTGAGGNDTVGGNFSYNSAFDGGAGTDLLDMSFVPSTLLPVSFDMTTGAWVDGLGTFSAVNFENYIGVGVAESVTGTSGENWIDGGAGNDTIFSGGSIDTVNGGDGDDVIEGGFGYDSLDGGAGLDTIDYSWLTHSVSGIVIDLAAGTWTEGSFVETIANFETVLGANGSESYIGTGSANRIDGGDGNDTINAGGGQDTVNGGNGDDYIYAVLGFPESIDGGAGTDTLNTTLYTFDYLVNLATGATNFAGESFLNMENIITGVGNDTIDGTAGANWIDGSNGTDLMRGGAGDDTYVVDNTGDSVVETAGNGNDVVQSWVTFSLAGQVIETLTLLGAANINGTGNGLGNTLNGNTGSNVLDGAAGSDTMVGGLGDDSYYVNVASDVVTEAAGEGIDTIFTALTYSLAGKQVENLTLEGAAAVNGTGNGLANILVGNAAANTLDGGSGHDRLEGRAGADTMIGGTGNDTYLVEDATDVVTEGAGGGLDLVESSVTYTLGVNVENLFLAGAAAINGTGNDLNNVLSGNAGNNILAGGLGNDTYYVQNAGDNVVEAGGAGTDFIYSTVSYSLSGRYAESILLTGAANINATGNSLANNLSGNDGNNTINGKGGADNLAGGLGVDTFLFETGSGADQILDFSFAQGDKINLNAYTGGVVNNALVVQNGADVVINFGGGNIITIVTALEANVEAQIIW
ncbi:hypothetical protein ABAC460_14205 [Asticcacaulis sp. AC460]|uniref:hypothetical protein n=1 Tax=Asticcacaulis sp. AC460 TaxID=1282360 RepID=UPI0003C3B055|nr:hypothetical protein [Asticcacaulis sp. AC460]ESQ88930.1 hypothetical protein ABAC460_14205 [Asticcacaulis sp. AC460]